MPFRHVVMFKWADHVTGEHIAKVSAGLSELPSEIDVIRNYVHGADVGVSEGNFDYCVVADFENVADFRAYRDHPRHVLLVAELIRNHVVDRAAIQYQTGPR